MNSSVLVSAEALRQIRSIDDWWTKNRPAAPSLFSEELAAAFDLLSNVPEAGRRYPHTKLNDVRRVMLRNTRYHVYYRTRGTRVFILSVWSALRGTGPNLRRA